MQVFRHLDEIPADFGPTVVAIGNFDGVHRGHQFVLQQVLKRSRELQAKSLVMTFDPHPVRVLQHAPTLRLITPLPAKLELLAKAGVDATLVLPFTSAFSETTPEVFAAETLSACLHASEVHEGDNFRFGKGAAAGPAELAELGKALGFSVVVYHAVTFRGRVASSSAIRALITAGDVREARWLLGRSFFVEAPTASGRGIGSKLTVPTINLAEYAELLPGNGVYVTQIEIGSRCFQSVTNVGNRPTFGEDSFAVETHILNFEPVDFDPEAKVRLHFLARIREERRWPTPEALKAQIMKDVAFAKRYFRNPFRS